MFVLHCLKTIIFNKILSLYAQVYISPLFIYVFIYLQEHFPIFRFMIDYLQRNKLSKQCLTLPACKTDYNLKCSKLLLTDIIKL